MADERRTETPLEKFHRLGNLVDRVASAQDHFGHHVWVGSKLNLYFKNAYLSLPEELREEYKTEFELTYSIAESIVKGKSVQSEQR